VKRLLIATHNPGKLSELKEGLAPLAQAGIKLISLKEVGITEEPDEIGASFRENALLKAKFYANLAHLPTISDDGGISIEALNGEPGVKSRLWLGREASDEELIDYTLERLKNFPKKDQRRAYFETCVVFYDPKTNQSFSEKERIYGYITDKSSSKRIKGYPFRSIFIVNKLNKYYDELTDKEHRQINHRLQAVKRLVQNLKPFLLQ